MDPSKENMRPWHFVQISNDGYNDMEFITKNIKVPEEVQKKNPDFPDDLNTRCYLNTLQEEHNLQTERKTVELNSHTASPRMYNTQNKRKEAFRHPVNVQIDDHTSSVNVAPYYADEKYVYTCDSTVNSPFLYDNEHYNRRHFMNGLVNDTVCCNTRLPKFRETSANQNAYSGLDPIRMRPTNCNPHKICSKHKKYLETIENAKIEKNTPFLYRSGHEKNYFSNYSEDIMLDLKNKKQNFLNWIGPEKPIDMDPMPPCPTARLCWPYRDTNQIQKTARFQYGSGPTQKENIFSCNNDALHRKYYGYDFIRQSEQCEIPCSFNNAHSTHLFQSPKLVVSTAGPFVEKQSNVGTSGPCCHNNCILTKVLHANPLSKANEFAFTIGEQCSHLFGQKNVSPPFLYPPRPLQRLFPNLFKIATTTTSSSRKKKGFFSFFNKEENDTPPCLHGGLLGALEDIGIMGAIFGNFFLDAVLVSMDILTHNDRQKNASDVPMCNCELPKPRYFQDGHYFESQDNQTRATGCWIYDAINNFMDAATIPIDTKKDLSLPQIPIPKTQVTGIKIIDKINNFLDNLYPQPKPEKKKVYKKDPYNALRRCFETSSVPLAKPWKMSDILLPLVPCRKLYNPEYADNWLSKLCSGRTNSIIPRCPQHIKYTNFDLIPPEENEDDIQHLTYPLYNIQQTNQSPSVTPALVYSKNY